MKKTIGYACMIPLLLSACSHTQDSFDCPEGKGLGCKSISDINQMMDKEVSFFSMKEMTQPVIMVDSHQSVERLKEEHLKVWIAPYQDDQGNLYDASTVHTVLRSGQWLVKERF